MKRPLVTSPSAVTCSPGPRERGDVRVTIEYSKPGNYERVARRLADAICAEFKDCHVETSLVPASGGVYEVSVNGKLVFSKRATYRLPADDEIFYHVRVALPIRSPPVSMESPST